MTRFALGTIVPSTTSGTQLATMLSTRDAAENSGHAGVGRPSYATVGMIYTENSTTPPHLFLAGAATDGSQDIDLTTLFAPRPGTLRVTAEVILPPAISGVFPWLWCDASQVARVTYSALLDAIAPHFTGTVTSGSPTITAVSIDFTQYGGAGGLIGANIEGLGIPGTAVVQAVTASTITLSVNATSTNTATAIRVFPHGNGNGSTTFNVPNCKGRVVIGRQDMGVGGSTGLITVSGAGFDGTMLGELGGAQSVILTAAQIASHTHAASSSGTFSGTAAASGALSFTISGSTGGEIGNHTHAVPHSGFSGGAGSGGFGTAGGVDQAPIGTGGISSGHTHSFSGTASGGSHTHTVSGTITVSTTVNANTGGDGAHNNTQPSIIENVVIKT